MKMLCAVLSLTALMVSSVALAAEDTTSLPPSPQWEFSGAANMSFTHMSIDQNPGNSSFTVATTADYFIIPALEVGLDASMDEINSDGTTESINSFLVGPTFNFIGAPINSFFITARVGVRFADYGSGYNFTNFAWEALVGKRVELGTHVAWAPEVGLVGIASATDDSDGYTTPSTTSLTITPFRFTILF